MNLGSNGDILQTTSWNAFSWLKIFLVHFDRMLNDGKWILSFEFSHSLITTLDKWMLWVFALKTNLQCYMNITSERETPQTIQHNILQYILQIFPNACLLWYTQSKPFSESQKRSYKSSYIEAWTKFHFADRIFKCIFWPKMYVFLNHYFTEVCWGFNW